MIVRTTFSVIILCFSVYAFGQVSDDFSDGDFTSNPVWTTSNESGEGVDFEIIDEKLVSKGPPANDRIYITTANSPNWATDSVSWSFTAGYYDAGSSSNFIEIYLMSDSDDLLASPEGYYIRMGESGSEDGIDLFKTSSSTPVIEDLGNLISAGIDTIRFLVTRNTAGNWTMSVDLEAGTSYQLIGAANDTEFVSGTHFGFVVGHSSARFDDYVFDDIEIDVTVQPDHTPPELTGVSANSSTQVLVDFSEKMDETTAETTGNYSIAGISVTAADIVEEDSSQVMLTVSTLINGQSYDLVVSNVQDKSGNAIASNSTKTFEYFVFGSPGQRDIVINEFTVDPSPPLGLPEAEFVELYNPTDQYFDLAGYRIKEVSATGTTELSAGLATYTLAPNSYVLICGNSNVSLFEPYGEVIGVSGFPAFNQSNSSVILLNSAEDVIDQVLYTSPPTDGITFEQINPFSSCNSELNYAASIASVGGTPGAQNTVFDQTPDTKSPVISSYEFSGNGQIILQFNEPMDSLSLINGTYSISGLTISEKIVAGSYFDELALTFTPEMTPGKKYTFNVREVTDCAGNALVANFIFGIGRNPGFNELLITEIMPDEDPVLTILPDAEYVEIYNNSEDILSLANVSFIDIGDTSTLRDRNLNPGEYMVLCATSDEDEFAEFGLTMGMSGFPSLNNTTESLALIVGDELISSVVYSREWHSLGKSDGGYALELKDLNNPCGGRLVWGSSLSNNGGTPGQANSNAENIPDSFGPELLEVVVSGADTLILRFNEALDYGADETLMISTNPSASVLMVEQDPVVRDYLVVILHDSLEVNKVYEIEVSNVQDCNGNLLTDGTSTFVRPDKAQNLDVILNEILFNPRTGGVDFVEIYNNTSQYCDLKDLKLGRKSGDSLVQNYVISQNEKIIGPSQYIALSPDPDILIVEYPKSKRENFYEMASFPSYPNEEGTVVLMDANNEILDEFSYHEDYHSSLLESVDGVSLERIDFKVETQLADNWSSAASTVGFATPGYVNSQRFDAPQVMGVLKIDPKVFVPGSAGSLSVQNFTTINYQFEQAGKFANVQVYDQGGRLVRELANGESLGTSGFMRWDGTNNQGSRVRTGYYLILFEVYDGSGKKNVLKETVVVGWR